MKIDMFPGDFVRFFESFVDRTMQARTEMEEVWREVLRHNDNKGGYIPVVQKSALACIFKSFKLKATLEFSLQTRPDFVHLMLNALKEEETQNTGDSEQNTNPQRRGKKKGMA